MKIDAYKCDEMGCHRISEQMVECSVCGGHACESHMFKQLSMSFQNEEGSFELDEEDITICNVCLEQLNSWSWTEAIVDQAKFMLDILEEEEEEEETSIPTRIKNATT